MEGTVHPHPLSGYAICRFWLPCRNPARDAKKSRLRSCSFEQYRTPILRCSVSFSVSIPDAEKIVQEVFLSLFRHLLLERSRNNLHGWTFRASWNANVK